MNIVNLILYDILSEAKQIGQLYHWTGLKSLYLILKSGFINPSTEDRDDFNRGISTTRSKEYSYGRFPVKIVLDGDLISHKYKIKPLNWWNNTKATHSEFEERIITNKAIPINYIDEIIFCLKHFSKAADYTQELFSFIEYNEKEFYNELVERNVFQNYNENEQVMIIFKLAFPEYAQKFKMEK